MMSAPIHIDGQCLDNHKEWLEVRATLAKRERTINRARTMSPAQLDDDETLMMSWPLKKYGSGYICLFKEHLSVAERGDRYSNLTLAGQCFGNFVSSKPMCPEKDCRLSTEKTRDITRGNN